MFVFVCFFFYSTQWCVVYQTFLIFLYPKLFKRRRHTVGLPWAQCNGSRHFFNSNKSNSLSSTLNLVLNRIAFLQAFILMHHAIHYTLSKKPMNRWRRIYIILLIRYRYRFEWIYVLHKITAGCSKPINGRYFLQYICILL